MELARKSSCGHKCSGGEIGTPQALHAIDENGLTAVNDSSVLCKQLCFGDIINLDLYTLTLLNKSAGMLNNTVEKFPTGTLMLSCTK